MAFSRHFNHQSQVNYIRLRIIKANFVSLCFLNISTKLCTLVTGAFTCEGSHSSSRSNNICIQALTISYKLNPINEGDHLSQKVFARKQAKYLEGGSRQAKIMPNYQTKGKQITLILICYDNY